MGAPQYEDGEMCWHEHGADVPVWFVIGWLTMVLVVLALVGWVLA